MNLRDLSLKRKLTLVAMLTSTIAVVLSSASFLIYDLVSFRSLLRQDLTTQAEIVAYNSAAALAFNDAAAANVTLSALRAKGDVVAAVLYTGDQRVFATYFREGNTKVGAPGQVGASGDRIAGDHIE